MHLHKDTELYIVPGAGSSDCNWHENIKLYKKNFQEVQFIKYDAQLFEDIDSCSIHLGLKIYFQHWKKNKIKIISHSMGSMLCLNLLKLIFHINQVKKISLKVS